MKTKFKTITLSCVGVLFALTSQAQYTSCDWISSTETNTWKQEKIQLQNKKASSIPDLEISGTENMQTFKGWGTCFNELGWDALNLLKKEEKEQILRKLFSPNGDMNFTIGRIPVGANDYARSWYSFNETAGDFEMKHFSIDRDKKALIPYIKLAQTYNPKLTFWASPWSPPSWMKTNQHYANKSGIHNDLSKEKEVPLFNDQFIQKPEYLKAYALYFSKFINAYKQEGINVAKLMYQNEAYTFAEYPACSWSTEGTIRFNTKYLGPLLARTNPQVELFLGTMNTNRIDIYKDILKDSLIARYIKGIGFQWEGGQVIAKVHKEYPKYRLVQSESECGWGKFDWPSAEHTFGLISHYLSNGCEQYTFWNAILSDKGMSTWGWSQNALIRINSSSKSITYTPEYYAVKHYCHFVTPGSKLLKCCTNSKLPILVFQSPNKKIIIVAGNFENQAKEISIKLRKQYLNVSLAAHSFNTFQLK